jgi:hypothetical protein
MIIPSKENILIGLKPRRYLAKGVEREFYTIGELAKALGRQVVTVRKWEREGILPASQFVVNAYILGPGGEPVTDDLGRKVENKRGRRRLYTAEQVVGIVQIAADEGILLDPYRPRKGQRVRQIRETNFTERVIALFRQELETAAA